MLGPMLYDLIACQSTFAVKLDLVVTVENMAHFTPPWKAGHGLYKKTSTFNMGSSEFAKK